MVDKVVEGSVAALRRGYVVKNSLRGRSSDKIRMAAVIEMANLGFIVRPEDLKGMTITALENMINDARIVIGDDRNMIPVYPGFPQQVQALDTMTLLIEQILHYWTFGAYLPNHPTIVREGLPIKDMLKEGRELRVLNPSETRPLMEEIVKQSIALSADDKALVGLLFSTSGVSLQDVVGMTKDIKNRENLQIIIEALRDNSVPQDVIALNLIKEMTHLDSMLRLILSLYASASHEKWQNNFDKAVHNMNKKYVRSIRIGTMPRSVRRAIIERIGELSQGYHADGLVARRDFWRRVMRSVHPYDFALSQESRRALDIIHTNVDYKTFNSLVEEALSTHDVVKVSSLLAQEQPGNLLRRLVSILRFVSDIREAEYLAKMVREYCCNSSLTTLISAYNGVLSVNDDHARVVRVAGVNNSLVERDVVKVDEDYVSIVKASVRDALRKALSRVPAPVGSVGVIGDEPMPLVRRDLSSTDRVMDRGYRAYVDGAGDTLRFFGHWRNNQNHAGYMDIGAVILDKDCEILTVVTWNDWIDFMEANIKIKKREWATYSGDKMVYPGDEAAEYIDIKTKVLKKNIPTARYIAFTVQSWSGWKIDTVDFVAGMMFRHDAEKGEVFDPRTVANVFKPTATSTQAVPFVYDLEDNVVTWIDSSNGSTKNGVSSTYDTTIGPLVYDEMLRPRLTMGDFAVLYAEAHNAETVDEPVMKDDLLKLL